MYDDASRNENFQIEGKLEGPTILADEVREAIKHIRHGKATGPDNISIEMIAALENFGIVQLTTILNQIYETRNIPEDLLKSIFVTLPKKAWHNRLQTSQDNQPDEPRYENSLTNDHDEVKKQN